MDWRQHFELGRQAAAGEWAPEPGLPQVAAKLPAPDLLPLDAIPEMEEAGGFDLARIPGRIGTSSAQGVLTSASAESWPHSLEQSMDYSNAWGTMSLERARSILNEGMWDGEPVNAAQRKAAHDFMMHMAPSGVQRVQLTSV